MKEAIGKVTGNKRTEVEGTAEKIAGKAQSEVGKAKDAVRHTSLKHAAFGRSLWGACCHAAV
jgi:uncharacterized protein YjbJ (UPF0337 family)